MTAPGEFARVVDSHPNTPGYTGPRLFVGGVKVDTLYGDKDSIASRINAAVAAHVQKAVQEAIDEYESMRAQWPNNRVACANCKKPVEVTALNALKCDKCAVEVPKLLNDISVRRAVEEFRERAAKECELLEERFGGKLATPKACAAAIRALANAPTEGKA